MTDPAAKVEEAERHHEEAENLTGEAAEEIQEVISEAEEAVTDVAETSQEEVSEAHETIAEAEHEVEEAVQEEAHDAAEELGEPALAEQIAEHLFRRLDESGKLPHTQHHASHPVSEGETVVADVEAVPAAVETEGEAQAQTAEHVADTAPEPTHWWYRQRHVFRRR